MPSVSHAQRNHFDCRGIVSIEQSFIFDLKISGDIAQRVFIPALRALFVY